MSQKRKAKKARKGGSRSKTRPWRHWYSEYLTGGEFSEEFAKALIHLFRWVSRRYKHSLSCPVWIVWKRDEKGHPAGAKLEDAAQEVLYGTIRSIGQSVMLRKRYEEGMDDEEFADYIFTVMDNACLNTCKALRPLWWNIRDRLEDLGTLALIEKRKRVYVPSAWLKICIPEQVDFLELKSRLRAVPLYHGEMGEHLSRQKLQEVVDTIFNQVQAPIPLSELTDTVLQVFRARPDDTVPLEEPAKDEEGEETGATQFVHEPGTDDEPFVEVDMASWLRSALGDLKREHLLVLKYRVCFSELSLEKAAHCVRRILGKQNFGKSTAGHRHNEAVSLLRVMPKGRRRKMTRFQSRKYSNPFLPSSEEEERAYGKLFCDILHKWLATYGYSNQFLDEIGATV